MQANIAERDYTAHSCNVSLVLQVDSRNYVTHGRDQSGLHSNDV